MKIHICGIYGSGKSYLAKKLSQELGIRHYSLDDLKYLVKYSKIRSVEERIQLLKEICALNNWITEGTWSNYAEDTFRKADVILLLQPSLFLSSYRILKRYLLRKKQENDTLIETLKLIVAGYKYYLTKDPVSLYSHKQLINKYNKTFFVIKKKSDVFKIINKIKQIKFL